MQCPKCDGVLVRTRRKTLEKLIFSHTFRCRNCSRKVRESYLQTNLFGEFAVCPRCENPVPDRRTRPDRVDSMLNTPIRFLHRIMGGKLYHCVFCRLQFYDVRSLRPRPPKNAVNPEGADAANKASLAS